MITDEEIIVEQRWFVWSPKGHEPRFQHHSLALARQEAERLANACPGDIFFVLGCVGAACVAKPAIYRDFAIDPIAQPTRFQRKYDDGVPF